MRAPARPAGSVLKSSGPAWTTSALPSASKSDVGPLPSVTRSVTVSRRPVPSASIVMFGRSPACGPSGFSSPCWRFPGLKWPPADAKSGGSQRPTAGRRLPGPRRPGLRELVALLPHPDPVDTLAGGQVEEVGVLAAAEADVRGQLLAGRDVRELGAVGRVHRDTRTVLTALDHPEVSL